VAFGGLLTMCRQRPVTAACEHHVAGLQAGRFTRTELARLEKWLHTRIFHRILHEKRREGTRLPERKD